MPKKPLSAGDVIEARCTRCRVVTNHIIVAMVNDRVARVQCNTCDGVHNYHDPRPGGTAKTPAAGKPATAGAPRKSRLSPLQAEQAEWQSLNLDQGQAVPFDMNRGYAVDEVVNHPVFGLGVVRSLCKPNKMEVLFREGKKLLRCRF